MLTLSLAMALIVVLLLVGMPVAFVFGVGSLSFVPLSGKSISYLVPHAFWKLGSCPILSAAVYHCRFSDGASSSSDRLVRFINSIVRPIPVPLAFHTFGGGKDSAFGDINQHGPEGVRFFTKTKTITSRWPEDNSAGAELTIPLIR